MTIVLSHHVMFNTPTIEDRYATDNGEVFGMATVEVRLCYPGSEERCVRRTVSLEMSGRSVGYS
jgi:hypothetical protein